MTSNRSAPRRPPPHTAWLLLSSYAVWVLLTWTMTAEVLLVGAVLAAAVTVACLPVLRDTGRLHVTPRGVLTVLRLLVQVPASVVRANLGLARRIWSPSLPLRTGVVTVPTKARTDAGLCAVGVITSLIVDNQIVDVDPARHEMLFHAIDVPTGSRWDAYRAVNGPVDERIAAIEATRDESRRNEEESHA